MGRDGGRRSPHCLSQRGRWLVHHPNSRCGRLRGRQGDSKRAAKIAAMRKDGASWGQIVKEVSCSKATVAKRLKAAEGARLTLRHG